MLLHLHIYLIYIFIVFCSNLLKALGMTEKFRQPIRCLPDLCKEVMILDCASYRT